MKKLNRKGFTIVELVIVIAVIAILAAVLIPTFGNVIEKAHQSGAMQEAAACYKEAMAVDLADGKQDGKEGTTPISTLTGFDGTMSYSVNEADGKITFTYTPKDTKYLVTRLDDGTFSVTKTN